MNYKKVLEKLGFIDGKDFALAVDSFTMLKQSRMVPQVIHHPEVAEVLAVAAAPEKWIKAGFPDFLIDPVDVSYTYVPAVAEVVYVAPVAAYDETAMIHHNLVPAVLDVDGITIITPEVAAYDEVSMIQEFFPLPAPTQLQLDETWKHIQLSESDISLLISEYLKGKDLLRDPENDSINIVNGNIHSWSFSKIPQPTADELVALIALLNIKNAEAKRTSDLLALGKKSREACDKALDLISGHNQLTALTDIQITEMTTVFAPIVMALSVHKRPNLAKTLITAIVPDEVTITTQMKNDLLAILTIL